MNSFNLGINGSWWIYSICVIIGLLLALYTYRRTVPVIADGKRALLISLRTLAIALLLLLVFEPLLTSVSGNLLPPRLAVLLDNSISMTIDDAKGNRKAEYKKALEDSDFMSIDEKHRRMIRFDSEASILSAYTHDSLRNKGELTDLEAAFALAGFNRGEENIQAMLLISDGSYNSGKNPLYSAEKSGKPVYVIGIGDTAHPKDAYVQSVITNDIAYIENPVPVNVDVNIDGYASGSATVTFYDEGTKIGERQISITAGNKNYPLSFEYMPLKEGTRKLSFVVTPLQDEITERNNNYSKFIKVLKNKRRIALFAGAPSSDVSFIKNALAAEKGMEVMEFIQKQGATFYRNPDDRLLEEAELFILCGFPVANSPSDVVQRIARQLEKGKPLLFIASRDVQYQRAGDIAKYLPFEVVSSNMKEYLALPDMKESYLSNPLMRINGGKNDLDTWASMPPLFRTETFTKLKPGADIAMGVKVNNVPINEPMIITSETGGSKVAAVLAYGLYRWKLLGYAQESARGKTDAPDVFRHFISNSVRWLSVNRNSKLFELKAEKELYSSGEAVRIIGQVYDRSLNPVNDANISVSLKGPGAAREFNLSLIGNGRYMAELKGLVPGDYSLRGSAAAGGSEIGRDEGRFIVGDRSIEYRDLTMNYELLKQIAVRTGGKFYFAKDAGKFLNDLKSHPGFTERPVTIRSEKALWKLPWLTGIALLLFSIEWFLRKRSNLL